jgi:hypothetical protein
MGYLGIDNSSRKSVGCGGWGFLAVCVLVFLCLGAWQVYVNSPHITKVAMSIVPGMVEVQPDIYEYGSSVYIRASFEDHNKGVLDIMVKKQSWEDLNPDKRIVAMSIVTGDAGAYGTPMVAGLLLHYELLEDNPNP